MCGCGSVGVLLIVSVSLTVPGLASLSAEEEVSVLRCAKQGQLFSPLDQSCHPALSQGPCEEGVLVLDHLTLQANCTLRQCKEEDMVWDETEQRCVELYGREGCQGRGERYFFTMTGGTRCGCEEGWRRSQGGECEQAGTRGECKEGEILQQTQLSPGCDCQHWGDCQTFIQDAKLLGGLREAGGPQYRAGVERLAAQVCNKQEEKVCCSQSQSLVRPLEATELLQTLHNFYSRGVECSTNLCPAGQIPWPDRPGQCFTDTTKRRRASLTSPSNICRLVLTNTEEEEEVVSCEFDELSVRNVPGAFSSKCGRGRIWSRYRSKCVGLFF